MSRFRPVVVNLSMVALSVIAIIVLYSVLGPVMNMLNPTAGVWVVAREATYPGYAEFRVSGLHNEVRIIYDDLGIPHIYASDDEDVFFAMGYVHARDRLWQMDIQRRFAEGKLSEILGKGFVKKDLFMRIIGLDRAAETSAKKLLQDELLESYSLGVNYFIDESKRRNALPLEFKLIGYDPEPWTTQDSLAFARLMGWTLTNFFEPLHLSLLTAKLGKHQVSELFPVYSPFQVNFTVVPGEGSLDDRALPYSVEDVNKLDWFAEWSTGLDFESSAFNEQVIKSVTSILQLVAEAGDPTGELCFESNHWAISPAKSSTGRAMLANDPHLSLQMPSLWYEIQLSSPTFHVYGASLAGVPVILIGRNDHIAWGLTNVGIGVADFYVEKINPANEYEYWFRGSWRTMTQVAIEIQVRDEQPVQSVILLTAHGPVLTQEGLTITMRWTGADPVREAGAMMSVNRASDYDEFMNAIREWEIPPQNFMYADDRGNIAVTVAGRYPTRSVSIPDGKVLTVVGSRGLLNGTGDQEWTSSIPFEDIPHALNPIQGYLAGPNQMSAGPKYPYLILSGWWDPGGRAHRINDLLKSVDRVTFENMQQFQSDIYDYFASLFVPKLLDATDKLALDDPMGRESVDYLRRWDFRMDKEDVAPTIWWYWLSAFYNATIRPLYDQNGISGVIYPTPETLWLLVADDPKSDRFGGDFGKVAVRSLEDAATTLTRRFGSDPSSWKWGSVHQLFIPHLSGLAALSEGPFPEDGDAFTLMAAPHIHSDFTIEAYSSNGPSWRMVSDLASDGPSMGVYPGGQSGNVASVHYSDELQTWLEYRYHDLLHPQTADSFPTDRMLSTLRMVPS